jgi:hypothetical protein
MEVWAVTGEDMRGRYFWCSDGLIVQEPGVSAVLTGLLDSGEFQQVRQHIDDPQ